MLYPIERRGFSPTENGLPCAFCTNATIENAYGRRAYFLGPGLKTPRTEWRNIGADPATDEESEILPRR